MAGALAAQAQRYPRDTSGADLESGYTGPQDAAHDALDRSRRTNDPYPEPVENSPTAHGAPNFDVGQAVQNFQHSVQDIQKALDPSRLFFWQHRPAKKKAPVQGPVRFWAEISVLEKRRNAIAKRLLKSRAWQDFNYACNKGYANVKPYVRRLFDTLSDRAPATPDAVLGKLDDRSFAAALMTSWTEAQGMRCVDPELEALRKKRRAAHYSETDERDKKLVAAIESRKNEIFRAEIEKLKNHSDDGPRHEAMLERCVRANMALATETLRNRAANRLNKRGEKASIYYHALDEEQYSGWNQNDPAAACKTLRSFTGLGESRTGPEKTKYEETPAKLSWDRAVVGVSDAFRPEYKGIGPEFEHYVETTLFRDTVLQAAKNPANANKYLEWLWKNSVAYPERKIVMSPPPPDEAQRSFTVNKGFSESMIMNEVEDRDRAAGGKTGRHKGIYNRTIRRELEDSHEGELHTAVVPWREIL